MHCDVIVPVYNNAPVLPLSLPALFRQTGINGWTVGLIISDDGSADDSVAVASKYCQGRRLPFKIITGKHTGAAGARSRAIAASSADVVLLLGADIVLKDGALAGHLIFHQNNPAENAAALGWVTWDPTIKPTPWMEWMTHGGSQNDYDALLGKVVADPGRFFYGANLSLKRRLLKQCPFSEKYDRYGWEDLDLGCRLAKEFNLTLHVLPGVVGHHHHKYSGEQILQREFLVGRGYATFIEFYPEVKSGRIGSLSHNLKYWLVSFLGLGVMLKRLACALGKRWSVPRLFRLATAVSFWQGFYSIYPQKIK